MTDTRNLKCQYIYSNVSIGCTLALKQVDPQVVKGTTITKMGFTQTSLVILTERSGGTLSIDNHRFIICDPTYINAPIGANMPGLDCDKIEVIVLE